MQQCAKKTHSILTPEPRTARTAQSLMQTIARGRIMTAMVAHQQIHARHCVMHPLPHYVPAPVYQYPYLPKKNTSPSIHVRDNSNGTVCYIDLVLGSKPNAINVKYNNQTHHTTNQTTLTHEHNNMFLLLFLQH